MAWTAPSPVGQSLSVLLAKESVGVRIRQARREASLTQAELAARVGLLHPQQISNYERGVSEPAPTRLRSIAEVTGKSLAFFFHGEEEPSRVLQFPGQDHQLAHHEQVEALHQRVEEQMAIVEAVPGRLEGIDDQLEAIAASQELIAAKLVAIVERLDDLGARLEPPAADERQRRKRQQ
jgi:transcriptional regulator with XRE-family HTH domain